MRADLTFEMPPGRIASSTSATGASRTASQRREALAQAQVGDVAVAVVGGLREHRQHQLGDRVAVRAHQRDAVDLAQAVADRARTRARGWARSRTLRSRHARRGAMRGRHDPRIRQPAGHRHDPREALAISSPRCSRSSDAHRRDRRAAGLLAQRAGSRDGDAGATPCRCTCTACPPTRDDWLARSSQRSGGLAPDLPGFGRSGKPGSLQYTIAEYDRFLERFLTALGVERVQPRDARLGRRRPRLRAAPPERVERLVLINAVPFLPGYRWHRTARIWRTPVLGELAMGATTAARCGCASRESNATPGTDARGMAGQRARPLRPGHPARDPAPVPQLAARGARGGRRAAGALQMPALVVWGMQRPLHPRALRRASTRTRSAAPSCSSCPTPATGRGSTGPT